ncbi:MAG: hypothetical protein GY898_08590 [Proteobacteria bacterium]|nr:hypothetical protein [Pseudomonadota bacterium]
MRLLMLATVVVALAACGPDPVEAPPTPEAPEDGDGSAMVEAESGLDRVQVGDWTAYGEPDEAWDTDPLTATRWAHVSAELACAGRANHGDPEAHTAASRRILAHHKTTAEAVMTFGIEVNGDEARAHSLGELVAAATETCR